jgi:hypothetical protein
VYDVIGQLTSFASRRAITSKAAIFINANWKFRACQPVIIRQIDLVI